MTRQYGAFELNEMFKGKVNEGRGVYLLLPNGYVLSIQQRNGMYWREEDNTAELAIYTPSSDGRMVRDRAMTKMYNSGRQGYPNEDLGFMSVQETTELFACLTDLPEHLNWKENLVELNASFPLTSVNPATILTDENEMTPVWYSAPTEPGPKEKIIQTHTAEA